MTWQFLDHVSFKRRAVPSPSPLSLLTGRVMDPGDTVVRSLSIHGHGGSHVTGGLGPQQVQLSDHPPTPVREKFPFCLSP